MNIVIGSKNKGHIFEVPQDRVERQKMSDEIKKILFKQ